MVSGTEFAAIARALQAEAHRLGLTPPAFRGVYVARHDRAIKRWPDHPVVIVKLGRDAHAVAQDLVEGVLAANHVDPDHPATQSMRSSLWEAAGMAIVG